MLNSLTIKGFRCFRELHVEPLTRVNLFVGKNSSGKTSVLDAAELAASGSIEGLMRSAVRRGERILTPEVLTPADEQYAGHVIDPSHLFLGHDLKAGNKFAIESAGDIPRSIQCTVEHASVSDALILSLRFVSHLSPKRHADRLSISPAGGVLPPPRRRAKSSSPVNFLQAEGIDPLSLNQLWDRVVLTPSEETVIAALQIIEPRVDRFAFVGGTQGSSPSILVKLSGMERPLPLATLGGGMEHLLALGLALSSARKGFLCVDEIDTGLHYTVMADMWRLVVETAKRLDVQVMATTHSLDCVRALARLRRRYPEIAEAVTLHRLEKAASRTIVYDVDDIVVAAEGDIEVR
jgi:putative AbiEii toxin of type IV toxin-antitoxin system/AAA domain-containing protein